MSKLHYAPCVVFAFNRPTHLRKTFQSLANNAEACDTDLIIYCDGPRTSVDNPQVREVRDLCRSEDLAKKFKSVRVIEREKNMGLAGSIIGGVTEVLAQFERVIVLEDDLLVGPYFLRYMNDALEFYKEVETVTCIHGYSYPIPNDDLPETYFLLGGDCWGWATWRRGWALFNPDGRDLLQQLQRRGLEFHFDVSNSYDFVKMLRHQIEGKNNSWAIRWRASTYLAGGLTLYPRQSLVKNIGFDGSGTHCDDTNNFSVDIFQKSVEVNSQPLVEHQIAFDRLKNYFEVIKNASSRKTRILSGLKKMGKRFANVISG